MLLADAIAWGSSRPVAKFLPVPASRRGSALGAGPTGAGL